MLSREEILARKIGQSKFMLPDGSGEVAIRGINHAAAAEVGVLRADGKVTEATAVIIHHGLVDPAMSLEDVQAWMEADDAGTLEMLAQEIGKLSRIIEGAAKSGVQKPRRR